MSKGIYTALSGAMAQNQRLETIANNIANSSTTGFKKDTSVFSEYLTANEKPPDVITVPRIPATTESFYDMQGGDKSYVNSSGTYSDFAQGALKNTGNTFDVALEGDGLFEVATPQGVRYTRSGAFKVDGEGRLVTNEGFAVLGEGTGDPAQRAIKISGGKNVTISFAGEIYDGEQLTGRLSVVNFQNKDALQKQGNSLFGLKAPYAATAQPAGQNTKIHQGFVEMSNINIIEEMTDMIATTRAFEANQASMKAHDQLDDKLVNNVPRLG